MSNVAIRDEMSPALTLYRFGIIRPVITIRTVGRVGNRYVWQGGQTAKPDVQRKKNFGDLRRIISNKCLPA